MMAHAAEHQKEGRLEEAEHLYRRVLRDNPHNVDALRLLASCRWHADREADAEAAAPAGGRHRAGFPAAMLDLGRMRKEQDRYAEAIECFDRAIALDPDNAQAHYLAAHAGAAPLSREAIESYQMPGAAPRSHRRTAGARPRAQGGGPIRRAVESYNACIRTASGIRRDLLEPREPEDLSLRRRDRRGDGAARRGADATASREVNFLFALAKAHEDRGDYERAWEYYRSGNEQQRTEVAYDPVQTEVVNDRLIEVFSAEFLAARAAGAIPTPSPIFIVGLPRSGSTLLEQILASHAQVEGTSELPYVGRLATSLNRNRAQASTTPKRCASSRPRISPRSARDYLALARMHRRSGRRVSSTRCRTTSRASG